MKDRLTEKQRAFTLEVFKYQEPGKAYYSFYKVRSMGIASACASKLLKIPKVQAFLEELRQKAIDDSVADVLERKQVLTEIVRGRLVDYTTCGPDRDLISIGPESPNTAALQKVTSRTEYDKDGAGVVVVTKIRLHNPIQAISELNKMDHIYEAGEGPKIDARTLIINVESERGRVLTQRLIDDDRHLRDSGHKSLRGQY